MLVDVLLGLQWGDEGKGKIVDVLAGNYDMVARFQGGPNAGHTLVFDNQKIVLHTIPSGIFHDRPTNLIGNGVVIDPVSLQKEIGEVSARGVDVKKNLFISKRAHLILPTHRILDAASEAAKGKAKIGSTLRGIGPAYMDKTGRNGLRIGNILSPNFMNQYQTLKEKHLHLLMLYNFEFDIKKEEKEWMEGIELIRSLNIVDGEYMINEYIRSGKKVLAEGAQGTLLDIDFGTYPYVTSSNTITAGVLTGLGVAPHHIGEVFGISKAYCTRVGSGPFPSELLDSTGDLLRNKGSEYGATTGRPRRCGWIDIPALKYSIMLNGVTQLIITKIDVFNDFKEIGICSEYSVDNINTEKWSFELVDTDVKPVTEILPGWRKPIHAHKAFDDFPIELKNYIGYLEEQLEVPVTMVSTGPERESLVSVAQPLIA